MKFRNLISIFFYTVSLHSIAQFAPAAGQPGTTAMYKDSSAFISWASHCTINRGYMDISNEALGYASAGDSTSALGIAGTTGVVSLGDGGYAILTFDSPIKNAPGYDFAVFENSFSDTFLELAFVEVSSDGINYFRFPATSNTQDTLQTAGFDSTDPTLINNLAGKYRAFYGTPFDLEELSGQTGLDINNITHVKIIDVVGCIQTMYATYDMNGNKVNDPWNTPYASGGFDLDALGVIHNQTTDVRENDADLFSVFVYPNPVTDNSELQFYLKQPAIMKITISDLAGHQLLSVSDKLQTEGWNFIPISMNELDPGIYILQLKTNDAIFSQKIIHIK